MAQTRPPLLVSKYVFACIWVLFSDAVYCILWYTQLWWYITITYCFDHSILAAGPRFTFKLFATHVKALTQADLSSSLVAWFTRQTQHYIECLFICISSTIERDPLSFVHCCCPSRQGHMYGGLGNLMSTIFSEVVAGTIAWREITKGEYILWSSIEKYGSVLSCW